MSELDLSKIKDKLSDKKWRLNNLYSIKDVEGNQIKFVMNWAQEDLIDNLWYFNTILKARQLGFSTFVMIYILDHCLFEKNQSTGVIAQGLTEGNDLFDNKIKFAYDTLPDWLKEIRQCTTDSARKIVFNNGSSITVGTSLRSGTYQILHVSEFGKISAKYPDKATEIVTGAFNTVHPGMKVFVESTAEGRSGHFFELCQRALKLRDSGAHLTPMDPRIHFYPWYKNENNVMPGDLSMIRLTDKEEEYFSTLENLKEIKLTKAQKAWYVKKSEQMMSADLMKREHPSTEEECFEASLEGAFYTEAMRMVRKNGQIGNVPHDPAWNVLTFWDIGLNDKMCIWFMQHIHNKYRFIDYYENSDQGLQHYATVLTNKGYTYGGHYLPHDGNRRQIGKDVKNTKQIAEQLGIKPITVVPRTKNLLDDIQQVRTVIPRCEFDAVKCAEGITGLDSYRKQWDERKAEWMEHPYHDGNSDRADAFRTFVVGYKPRQEEYFEESEAYAESDDDLFDI